MSINKIAELPQNFEAERAVIGACILDKKALDNAMEKLSCEDFYNSSYRESFEILTDMYKQGNPVDFVTFLNEMTKRGAFDRLGGQPFLSELIGNITTTSNVNYHAEIVKERALRRRLIGASNEIIYLAYKDNSQIKDVEEQVEKIIFNAIDDKKITQIIGIKELTAPVLGEIEKAYHGEVREFRGYSTGFDDLDRIISGFEPGSLNIIAARPSMGKTALALNIALFGGVNNQHILIFSLEMTAKQLVHRMLASRAKVSISRMKKGTLTSEEFYRLTEAAEILNRKNIYINESSELSALDLRIQCRRFKARYADLGLIIVDYLQLMRSGNKSGENRNQEVAEISKLLKSIAIELECPVIALSQLSRETERRTEKRPQLSNLRDSGAIEQDADTVIMLFREDYYEQKKTFFDQDSKVELRVAKNRCGETGMCNLVFQKEYTRFVAYAKA